MVDRGVGNSNGSMGNSNRGMSNDRSGNNRGMSNHGTGNHRGMGNDRTSNNGVGNLDWSRSIGRNSLIGDLSNISAVGISSVVVDNLGSAIRKSNSVGSRGGISISALLLVEVGSAVVISYSILVRIDSRGILIDGGRGVARSCREGEGSSKEGGENNGGLKWKK